MFDIGFWELIVLSTLALLVLGPERLPKVISAIGRWVGRARVMAENFKEQIEDEVYLDELSRAAKDVESDLESANAKLQSATHALNEPEGSSSEETTEEPAPDTKSELEAQPKTNETA